MKSKFIEPYKQCSSAIKTLAHIPTERVLAIVRTSLVQGGGDKKLKTISFTSLFWRLANTFVVHEVLAHVLKRTHYV